MSVVNFNLAPYCYLTHNGTAGKYDLSIVVPHGPDFTVTFTLTAPDDSDYPNTHMLKIPYTVEARISNKMFTSIVYKDVFIKATETKKIVKVFGFFPLPQSADTREYYTVQEDDDATDTLNMSGTVAPNCPHIYLPNLLVSGTDNPKGLIPFQGKDFAATNPETIEVVTTNLTDTISIVVPNPVPAGINVKMLNTLATVGLAVSGGNPGVITLRVEDNGTNPPTIIKAKTKRKNHNTQPGGRFRVRSNTAI